MWSAYAFGFGYALIVGSIMLWAINVLMWEIADISVIENVNRPQRMKWQPVIMGVIERTLYISSLLMGHGGFIAVWLGLKTAAGWKRWQDKETGRLFFSNSLFGSGLSILYAAVGYKSISWIESGRWFYVAIIPLLLILGTGGLCTYLERYARKN